MFNSPAEVPLHQCTLQKQQTGGLKATLLLESKLMVAITETWCDKSVTGVWLQSSHNGGLGHPGERGLSKA